MASDPAVPKRTKALSAPCNDCQSIWRHRSPPRCRFAVGAAQARCWRQAAHSDATPGTLEGFDKRGLAFASSLVQKPWFATETNGRDVVTPWAFLDDKGRRTKVRLPSLFVSGESVPHRSDAIDFGANHYVSGADQCRLTGSITAPSKDAYVRRGVAGSGAPGQDAGVFNA
jgi:hypothetical protein